MRFSRSYLHQQCDELEEYGLIRHLGNGVHVITSKGEQYLIGELDTGMLKTEAK